MKNLADEVYEYVTIQQLEDMVSKVYHYNGDLEDFYYDMNDENFINSLNLSTWEIMRVLQSDYYNTMHEYVKVIDRITLETIPSWEYVPLLEKNRKKIITTYFETFGEEKLQTIIKKLRSKKNDKLNNR